MPLRRGRRLNRFGRPGLVGLGRSVVIAGTATAASGAARRHAAYGPSVAVDPDPQSHVVPPPAAGATSIASQLKELVELEQQGVLTEEEFAAQKAKILGS